MRAADIQQPGCDRHNFPTALVVPRRVHKARFESIQRLAQALTNSYSQLAGCGTRVGHNQYVGDGEAVFLAASEGKAT